MECRFCESVIENNFLSLGPSPVSNAYLSKDQLSQAEQFFPLDVFVCSDCFLVQIPEYESPQNIFNESYAYYSSCSKSWLEHCEKYSEKMISEYGICSDHLVVELASNDGYLLQYFQKNGVPTLGVEPSRNVAEYAEKRGIETEVVFFGYESAKMIKNKHREANLIIGNNVFAHVPDINDFSSGISHLLSKNGIATLEFPHLLELMDKNQFDTVYHEHFSYLSLYTVSQILKKHNLKVFDVEKLDTHGGSLRVFISHLDNHARTMSESVNEILNEEKQAGLLSNDYYKLFSEKVNKIKYDLLIKLCELKKEGKKVCAYGAPAKGNTLLNYCGIKQDLIDFTVDISPWKQNKYLPGTHIPIHEPSVLKERKPDYILLLPWNLKNEIIPQLDFIKDWGGKIILPIPSVEVV